MSASSSNMAYLMMGISQNASESCSGRLAQTQQGSTLVVGNLDCAGGINIGSQVASQQINCRNDQQIAATARASANQAATASVSGLLPSGTSSANNFVEMQSQIAQTLQARCDASLVQTIKDETYKISSVVSSNGVCNILNQSADQRFSCVNNLAASAVEVDTVTQTATASVTGLDTDMLLVIFLIVAVIFIGGPFMAILGAPFEILEQVVGIVGDLVRGVIGIVKGLTLTAVNGVRRLETVTGEPAVAAVPPNG